MSQIQSKIAIGDQLAQAADPGRLIGVLVAVQGGQALVRRPQDGYLAVFDRKQVMRYIPVARLQRSPIVDALGRRVVDGQRVQLGDGRTGDVALALGVCGSLQTWDFVPRKQRGLVIVNLDGGGTEYVKSGDLLVLPEVAR